MGRGPSTVQRINFAEADQLLFTNNTLHANFTGTTNDCVLLFNAAGTYVGPTGGITDTNIVGAAANDGTIISITEPGCYAVELTVSQVGAVANIWGLSLNCAAAALTGPPTLATAGVSHVLPLNTEAAQTMSPMINAYYRITQTIARAAGGALVRGHAGTAAGGAPTGVVAANVAIRITKTFDIAF